MTIGLIRLITTQKVLKTLSVKGLKQHYLGSNQSLSSLWEGIGVLVIIL